MPVTVTNTRAVHGISLAPNGRFLASFIDNLINLWDIRNIEKPVSVYQMDKNINSLSWCATRSSTLGILQRDSPYVTMLDVHCPSIEMDTEPHLIKRTIAPFQIKSQSNSRNITLNNISWHCTDVERMLALSGSGTICDFRVQQRVAICFDPFNNLCGSLGVNLRCLNSTSPPTSPSDSTGPWDNSFTAAGAQQNQQHAQEDIADIIYRRALNDYGKLVSTLNMCIDFLQLRLNLTQ